MAKIWRKSYPIPWICTEGVDDFRADIGKYLLRVEKMDNGRWWWRVYFMEEIIPTQFDEHATSRDSAMGRAEGVYAVHLVMNRGTEVRFFKSAIQ